jgi:hypothetical protein
VKSQEMWKLLVLDKWICLKIHQALGRTIEPEYESGDGTVGINALSDSEDCLSHIID